MPFPDNFWRSTSFRNYANYAATAAFRVGMEELEALARDKRRALMCAEAVWWRCHRLIIADYLLADGIPVMHIMGHGKIVPAKMTSWCSSATGQRVGVPGRRKRPCHRDERRACGLSAQEN